MFSAMHYDNTWPLFFLTLSSMVKMLPWMVEATCYGGAYVSLIEIANVCNGNQYYSLHIYIFINLYVELFIFINSFSEYVIINCNLIASI